jgi:DNA (cytosine-5)-methyltransferase 1
MFSGVGGFRVGAELFAKRAGVSFKWVGRAELDVNADKTYTSYFGNEEKNWGDIQSLTGPLAGSGNTNAAKRTTQINRLFPEEVDVLFAGFPCQPFSSMGERKGLNDARGTLFFAIAAFLEAKRPRYCVLENVRGLKTDAGGKTLMLIKQILSELGYKVSVWTLNSADYGVPQTRRRVYIVGDLGKRSEPLNDDNIPQAIKNKDRKYPTTWHLLERDVRELYPKKDYYLSERIKPTILSKGSGNYSYEWSIDNLVAKPLCRTMHKMHRASQDNYVSDAYINGKYDMRREIVVHSSKGKCNIRRLTPLEAFRLQGLPDKMIHQAKKIGVSDTQLYMQAGNAVSATTVAAVLEKLIQS